MKSIYFLALLVATAAGPTSLAQTSATANTFHGALATRKSYKALYVLNESDEKKMRSVIRNINNVLEDPRLKGKLQIELVVFGDGLELFKKTNGYDSLLTGLQKKGVLLAQCENTLRERKISKEELWPFISFVPSANGEIILRQYEGWAVVKP